MSERAEILGGRALWDPRPVLSPVRLIRDEHIDLVHTHLEGADVIGGAAARLSRRPLVSTLHIVHEWRANLRRGRQVLADGAARWLPQRFIAVSEPVKESHVRQLHLDPAKIEVLPNVSLADRSLPDGFDRQAFRPTLAPAGSVVLCTVATLIANKKDVPSLLRAMPAVRDALDRDVTLIVVGDGPQRPELERLATDLGVADAVRFTGYRDDAIQIRDDGLRADLVSAARDEIASQHNTAAWRAASSRSTRSSPAVARRRVSQVRKSRRHGYIPTT